LCPGVLCGPQVLRSGPLRSGGLRPGVLCGSEVLRRPDLLRWLRLLRSEELLPAALPQAPSLLL
jgi:hypothetical protein